MSHFEQTYTARDETKNLVEEVVKKAFDSVVSTMGPNGDLALIIETNLPVVTKDGVRVAKAMEFNEIRRNCIAKMITSAAIKTDEMVGDGTTTTVMMVKELYEKFGSDLNFYTTKFIDELVSEAKIILENNVIPITPESEEFKRMVYTTSNYQNNIADTVIDIYKRYNNPNLTLKRSRGNTEDIVEENRNIVFNARYPHGSLKPSTARNMIEFQNSVCIIVNGYVHDISPDIGKSIIDIALNVKKPIIVFARDFEGSALDGFVQINQYLFQKLGPLNNDVPYPHVIPFNINGAGTSGTEIVNDLARILDIPAYSDISAIKNIEDPQIWMLDSKIKIDLAGIYIDPVEKVAEGKTYQDRVSIILATALPVYAGMTFTEKASPIGHILFDRISRLRGENVTIWVSGLTDSETSERYYLYEDAARVAASSLRFGVIHGIGWGYIQVAETFYQKYSYLENETSTQDQINWTLIKDFIDVMTAQYRYLNDCDYEHGQITLYRDLVTMEASEIPQNVYDNGSAAIIAMESGWSVVKRLAKLSCILGKTNSSYV